MQYEQKNMELSLHVIYFFHNYYSRNILISYVDVGTSPKHVYWALSVAEQEIIHEGAPVLNSQFHKKIQQIIILCKFILN